MATIRADVHDRASTPSSTIASSAMNASLDDKSQSESCTEFHPSPRQMGVLFTDLSITGIGAAATKQKTVGSVLNPAQWNAAVQNLRHPAVRHIISGFNGLVKPGEMLLVLGRPSAGCTTLLKALANRRANYHSVNGSVFYGSFTPSEVDNAYRGDVQYCAEDDEHFATLTTEQTLGFAASLRAPVNQTQQMREEYRTNAVNHLVGALGLAHARKTLVGDASIRGVSGGEKRRISIAEVLSARPSITCWDNATRGLDSSNAIELVKLLRKATTKLSLTTIMSLYQAGNTLYEQFDKVCVIYEGQMAYFGPASSARQYFIDMGYTPAPRQTIADFLVAVTDPVARKIRPGIPIRPPQSASEFANYFNLSSRADLNKSERERYISEHGMDRGRRNNVRESADINHEIHVKSWKKESVYLAPLLTQISVVVRRRYQRLLGNVAAVVMNMLFFVFQAIVMGTVFLNSPETTSAYFSRGGVLFFALLFATLMAMAEIPSLYSHQAIVAKQRDAALYHPFVEALAYSIIDIPLSFCTILLFAIVLYFLSGLQRSAEQFFTFFLVIFVMGVTMKTWFRMLAAAFRSQENATSLAGVSLLAFAIYTGYYIPQREMIGALKWISHINPFRYGFEAITTNEFRTLNGMCASLVPQGPGYENASLSNQACAAVGSIPGEAFVEGSRYLYISYGFYHRYLWRDLGILVGFAGAFFVTLLLLSQIRGSSNVNTAIVRFSNASKRRQAVDEEKGDARGESREISPPATPTFGLKDERPRSVFSFENISYTVPAQDGQRKLLDNISGYIKPGTLVALMGESGAGKTTLLNVLALRADLDSVQGDHLINGMPATGTFSSNIGYCEQADTHLESATVREALLFSAKLRQPYNVTIPDKERHVDHCLDLCGLNDYSDALLGSLSLELRKRASIAIELAAKPMFLLFLDEPTSGLDSQSAWSIITLLRRLANAGQAILCTIHQVLLPFVHFLVVANDSPSSPAQNYFKSSIEFYLFKLEGAQCILVILAPMLALS
ncbi:hypothetical protein HGRIS_003145 [Hohenbuehelia grisea]|uniref:ABC transporter domain-containing protein n=1 Tax=Hohenbuehelia grisea TaxID=104357 RepID=A0ABR3JMU5_9AGAR